MSIGRLLCYMYLKVVYSRLSGGGYKVSKNKELKQAKVEEIKGKMEKAESMIFAEYQD